MNYYLGVRHEIMAFFPTALTISGWARSANLSHQTNFAREAKKEVQVDRQHWFFSLKEKFILVGSKNGNHSH